MGDDATPRRRSSAEIPMLFKAIVCGFVSIVTWLFASSDDIGRGGRIGLYVVSAVSGLFAVVWLVGWVHSLAATFTGSDDAMVLDGHSADDAEHGSDAPLEAPVGMEFRFGDEEPEETPVAASPSLEQGLPRDDSWLEVILGMIVDILSVFPAFFAVVTFTPLLVYYVTCVIAGWIGLAPAPESNMASLFVILMFFLSLGFGWRWRSRLTETDASRLQNAILLLCVAEVAAIGVCIGLAVVGVLVLALGDVAGFWRLAVSTTMGGYPNA